LGEKGKRLCRIKCTGRPTAGACDFHEPKSMSNILNITNGDAAVEIMKQVVGGLLGDAPHICSLRNKIELIA